MDDRYLKAGEVAALLSLSRSAVYNYIASGEIPSVRIGSSVRVPYSALEALVLSRSQTPDAEAMAA